MNFKVKNSLYVLCLAAPAWFGIAASTAQAATLTSEGHAAGAQCAASDVNNSGIVVGTCSPGNATGASVPFVSTTIGTEIILPVLTTGQACGVGGVTNGGVITGGCRNGGNNSLAVTWSASAPTNPPVVLNPLSGLLGLPLGADVSSGATGYSQTGAVVGESISAVGNATAVLWANGSGTAFLAEIFKLVDA